MKYSNIVAALTGGIVSLAVQGIAMGQSESRFIRQPRSKAATSKPTQSNREITLNEPKAVTAEVNGPANGVARDGGELGVNANPQFGPVVGDQVASPTPQANPALKWVSRSDSQALSVTRSRAQSIAPQSFDPQSGGHPTAAHASVNPNTASGNMLSNPGRTETVGARYQDIDARVDQIEAKIVERLVAERLAAEKREAERLAAEQAEAEQQRMASRQPTKASLVSHQILNDPNFARDEALRSQVIAVENPQGWQSIGERLSSHIRQCESLLRRGAHYSARQEAESGLAILLRHLDVIESKFQAEPAWRSAMQALREAEDFTKAKIAIADQGMLQRVIDSHTTPVLKNADLQEISPAIAAQHYYQFATSELTRAAQGHPWASELYYALGRTYQAEADSDRARVDSLRLTALTFYRASRSTLPSNAVACNQLGFLLLQMDRPQEARAALMEAVRVSPEEAYLSNLAEASRRLGDAQTQTWAQSTIATRRSQRPPQPRVPQVVEVDPQQFVAISPRTSGPPAPPAMNNPNFAPNVNVNMPATSLPPRTASAGPYGQLR